MSLPRRRAVLGLAAFLAVVTLTGASRQFDALASTADEVVLYLAADEAVARPVIEAFEKRTGTKVRVVAHDASSDRPLAERVRESGAHAVWSSEPMRAIALAHEGVLASHKSKHAGARDEQWIGKDSRWHGFGATIGGFALNTADITEKPADELSPDRWQFRHAFAPSFSYGMFVIARPETSDSIAHLAMLYQMWGEPFFQSWCFQTRRQEMRILPDDAEVARAVAMREAGAGLLDAKRTARIAASSEFVEFIPVDHEIMLTIESEVMFGGQMVIPQVIGLVEGSTGSQRAAFVDFVLSPEGERILASSEWGFIPLHDDLKDEFKDAIPERIALVDLDDAASNVPDTLRVFRRAFPE